MRKRMHTLYTEKLVHKYSCAKSILGLDYPILAANIQFYLYCKCKTTITESSKYIFIYHHIGLVLQNKSEKAQLVPFLWIFNIVFANIMLHCSPWYIFFHRANLDITLKVTSFYIQNIFFIPADLLLSAAACCYICSQVTVEVSLVN